eukprot:8148149-Lingulodinium_polyedra.AAC.1
MGPHRRRNIPRSMKEGVAEAAAKGRMGRSGRAIMAVIAKFRRQQEGRQGQANTWTWLRNA